MAEAPMESLHEFLDRIWAMHADIGPKEQMPTIVAQDARGAMFVFKTPWENDTDKLCLLAMVGLALIKNNCTRYVFVHEAWIASYTSRDGYKTQGMPSERPDRKEALIAVAVEWYTGDRLAYTAEIEHLPGGKRRIKERQALNGSGRLYDLFGDAQVIHSRATH